MKSHREAILSVLIVVNVSVSGLLLAIAMSLPLDKTPPPGQGMEVKEKVIVILHDPITGHKEMFFFKDGTKHKMQRLDEKARGAVPQNKYPPGRRGCA